MTIDPDFRTQALNIARAIQTQIAKECPGETIGRAGSAAERLFEHVEHIMHGRKSCDGPHLGADVQHLFRHEMQVAAMALLTAIEFARYGDMGDAWILAEDAAGVLGLPLRPKTA